LWIGGQHQRIQDDACSDDEFREAEVTPQAVQECRIPP
jgi:hypothetical protein